MSGLQLLAQIRSRDARQDNFQLASVELEWIEDSRVHTERATFSNESEQ